MYGFFIDFLGVQFIFQSFVFFFEDETLVFEEAEFCDDFDVLFLSFDVDVNILIGLLCQDEIVSHSFEHIHEGFEEMVFLFDLKFLLESIHFCYFFEDVFMDCV